MLPLVEKKGQTYNRILAMILTQQSAGATPESLLQKMEEETRVNRYIVTQKLPKEMSSKKKIVESLMRVTNLPALGQNDITDVSVL